jgi:hypothetical protein
VKSKKTAVGETFNVTLTLNRQQFDSLLSMFEALWQNHHKLFAPRTEALALLDKEIEDCAKNWHEDDPGHSDSVLMAPVYRQLMSQWDGSGEISVSYSATRAEFRRALKEARKGGRAP